MVRLTLEVQLTQAVEQRPHASMFVGQQPTRQRSGAQGSRVSVIGQELLDGGQPLLGRQGYVPERILDGDQSSPIVGGAAGAPGLHLAGRTAYQIVGPAPGQEQHGVAELQQGHPQKADDLQRLRSVLAPARFLPALCTVAELLSLIVKSGLTASQGDSHQVSATECSHFVFREDGHGQFMLTADVENVDAMMADARRVSSAFAAHNVEHLFEVYGPNDALAGTFKYPALHP